MVPEALAQACKDRTMQTIFKSFTSLKNEEVSCVLFLWELAEPASVYPSMYLSARP